MSNTAHASSTAEDVRQSAINALNAQHAEMMALIAETELWHQQRAENAFKLEETQKAGIEAIARLNQFSENALRNMSPQRHPDAVARPISSNLGDADDRMHTLGASSSLLRNTVKLEADVGIGPLTKTIFSASGIYLGPNEVGDIVVLTNGHCMMPWYQGGAIRAQIYIVVEGDDIRYPVSAVEIHPKFFNKSNDKRFFDIAKLKLDQEIRSLNALRPDYDIPCISIDYDPFIWDAKYKKIHASTLIAVGYGTNGDLNGRLSYNDGRKKSVTFDSPHLRAQTFEAPFIRTLQSTIYTPKNLGIRYGMSGGGTYLIDTEGNVSLMALNTFPDPTNSMVDRFYRLFQSYGKYLTALGIPMPFMNPLLGDSGHSLILQDHRDFIEASVIDRTPGFTSWVTDQIFNPDHMRIENIASCGLLAATWLGWM